MKRVERNIPTTPFKVKPLGVALAIAMGAAVTVPTAQAVNFAEDGLGEVLLFPYYTVRNGFDTNINITNTSDATVAFKIRFREGRNSRDARDFNVVLSPFDVWTATVTESPDGTRARLRTGDQTCTVPRLPIDLGGGVRAVDFTNFDYTGANEDGGPGGFDRTKEGYIEVINMGTSYASTGANADDSTVAWNAKHVDGVPRNCTAVSNAFNPDNLGDTRIEFAEPMNVLKGTASLINVGDGKGASYEPVVLANFFNPGYDDGATNQELIFDPASRRPNLADVNPSMMRLHSDSAFMGEVWTGEFAQPVNAVSALLSRAEVINQFSVNPGNNAMTDWVVTFPTKYEYTDAHHGHLADTGGTGTLQPPFDEDDNTTTFQGGTGANVGRSCVTVGFNVWDREEFRPDIPDELQFSPPPPDSPESVICNEVNIITFNGHNLFGSALSENVNTPADFDIRSGWMRLRFPNAGELVSAGGTLGGITGLPVIGFAMTTLENGVAGDNLLNYGMIFEHAYTRDISGEVGE